MDNLGFDWEYLGRCQYGVPSSAVEQETDCGEMAIIRVWWAEDESDEMFVCSKHFRRLVNDEKLLPTQL